jgi:genome maintenance exonuclease 1
VLGGTSDNSGLEAWRKRIGEKKAEEISRLARDRGTVMHRLIELYKPLPGDKKDKLLKLQEIAQTDNEINEIEPQYIKEGWKFFYKFYLNSSNYFDRVEEVYAAEKFLWCTRGGGYAGTVDNVSKLKDGTVLIIDYKNSRKPKRREWIQDYFIQASAYFVAYWERTGIVPDGAEIWIANEIDALPQTFHLTKDEVKLYFKQFTQRLKQFYKTNPPLDI